MKTCPLPACTCQIHDSLAACPWCWNRLSYVQRRELLAAQNQCARGEITVAVRDRRLQAVYRHAGLSRKPHSADSARKKGPPPLAE